MVQVDLLFLVLTCKHSNF